MKLFTLISDVYKCTHRYYLKIVNLTISILKIKLLEPIVVDILNLL